MNILTYYTFGWDSSEGKLFKSHTHTVSSLSPSIDTSIHTHKVPSWKLWYHSKHRWDYYTQYRICVFSLNFVNILIWNSVCVCLAGVWYNSLSLSSDQAKLPSSNYYYWWWPQKLKTKINLCMRVSCKWATWNLFSYSDFDGFCTWNSTTVNPISLTVCLWEWDEHKKITVSNSTIYLCCCDTHTAYNIFVNELHIYRASVTMIWLCVNNMQI